MGSSDDVLAILIYSFLPEKYFLSVKTEIHVAPPFLYSLAIFLTLKL